MLRGRRAPVRQLRRRPRRRSTAAVRSTARSSTSTTTTTTRTAGPWFDLQDSRWLLHAAAQVQLSLSVEGSGFVTSGVNGQECDGSCTTEWDAGTDIELVADALPGFGFGSWTGACAGTSRLDVLRRARRDDRGRRRLPAAPPARAPDHGARHRHRARTCTARARARRRASRGPGSRSARRPPRAGASSAGAAAAAALASPAPSSWARAARRPAAVFARRA